MLNMPFLAQSVIEIWNDGTKMKAENSFTHYLVNQIVWLKKKKDVFFVPKYSVTKATREKVYAYLI